jgi:hypothetical protein
MSYISKWFGQLAGDIDHVIFSMDTTQWGILASIITVVGFMALRSRI